MIKTGKKNAMLCLILVWLVSYSSLDTKHYYAEMFKYKNQN